MFSFKHLGFLQLYVNRVYVNGVICWTFKFNWPEDQNRPDFSINKTKNDFEHMEWNISWLNIFSASAYIGYLFTISAENLINHRLKL